MKDLIYDMVALKEIREKFPDVKVIDASDFIHTDRVEVEVEADEKQWLHFLIRSGIINISMWGQMHVVQGTELIRSVLDEMKKEREHESSV